MNATTMIKSLRDLDPSFGIPRNASGSDAAQGASDKQIGYRRLPAYRFAD